MVLWIRTCSRCGHRQKAIPPSEYRKGDVGYQALHCKSCRAEAMDHGRWATDTIYPTAPRSAISPRRRRASPKRKELTS